MRYFSKLLILPAMAMTASLANAQEPSFYRCDDRPVRINIPSMPLGEATAMFTRATHCPVSLDTQEVANTNVAEVPTFAVKGRMTPSQALRKMLSSSPLKSRMIKGGFSVYQN